MHLLEEIGHGCSISKIVVKVKKARSIEAHIKKMNSRKYIENLSGYTEIVEKLQFLLGLFCY